MFKGKKSILALFCATVLSTSYAEATQPNTPGDYIGVTAINETSVRINFLDNSDNETGFRVFGEDINISIPAHDENEHPYVYANISGLTCDKIYVVQALAYNEDGTSAPTTPRAFNMHSTFGIECPDSVNLNDGLVGYYEFESNTLDSSGYNNDAIAHGTVSYQEGAIGQAIHFDQSYLTIPPSESLTFENEFSLTAFIHPDSLDEEWVKLFFGKEDLLDLSSYNFVSWIFKENQLSVFINNELIQTVTMDTDTVKAYLSILFAVDDDSERASNFYTGELDDVRFYTRALNPAEQEALYQLAQ